MLVLTVKDQSRIALFYADGDEQTLCGWLKLVVPPSKANRVYWELQNAFGEVCTTRNAEDDNNLWLPGLPDSPATPGTKFSVFVTPNGLRQWQAKFNAPKSVRFLREEVIRKAQQGVTRV